MDSISALPRADPPPRRRPHRLRRWLWRVFSRLRGRGPTRLLDPSGLVAAGQRLMRGGRHGAALVVFDFEDLTELGELYGDRARREAVRQVAQALHRIGGTDGVAARTGATQFSLLVPGCSAEQAVARAVRELGMPCRLELDLDGGEAVLLPDLLAEACPPGASGLGALHRQMDERLAEQRQQRQQREQYLRRSRERYSHSR